MTGRIFDIQRFSVHDGPGIRTTVFMKGCPLRCPWCHNPEGLSRDIEPQFFKEECIACGRCHGDHTLENAGVCPAEALTVCGRDIDEGELFCTVMRDRDYYGDGGGVTFSGGECLLQADFVARMLSRFKAVGISTAVDTSGAVPFESIEKTLPYTDYYLYDLKCINAELHRRVIGGDNSLILENLDRLRAHSAKIYLRVPVIPGFNDNAEEMERIAAAAAGKGIISVTLMPYHTLGKNKYETLGRVAPFDTPLRISPEKIEEFKEIFNKNQIITE